MGDLLPVARTIAFDCPADGCSKSDINVSVVGPDNKKCSQNIRLNSDGTFTCEFSTSLVGEHNIEIVIKDEQLNVTPNFYTYDASRIKVGQLPQGYIGLPVEFDIDGKGAGFGNLEIVVNGGRVTSHVHTISKEQFQANFIPHDPGRHRVDVKFNGEKVPNSPWFVDVKDPNTPLLAPMLVANRGTGSKTENNTFNSSIETNGISKNNFSLNNKFSSSQSKLNTDTKASSSIHQSSKTENISSLTQNTRHSEDVSNFSSSTLNRNGKVEELSSLKKHKSPGVSFEKSDFGSFSLLQTPSLLSGNKTNKEEMNTNNNLSESKKTVSASTEQLNTSTFGASYSPKTTYSTTIERSINSGSYSSLNRPHEARLKGLTNGSSSTMPKSISNSA